MMGRIGRLDVNGGLVCAASANQNSDHCLAGHLPPEPSAGAATLMALVAGVWAGECS